MRRGPTAATTALASLTSLTVSTASTISAPSDLTLSIQPWSGARMSSVETCAATSTERRFSLIEAGWERAETATPSSETIARREKSMVGGIKRVCGVTSVGVAVRGWSRGEEKKKKEKRACFIASQKRRQMLSVDL